MTQPQRAGRMPTLQAEGIEEYAEAHTTAEAAHLAALARETIAFSANAQMMVGPLEGQALAFLVFMLKPRHVLEIGTFTGYSALSMAAALPPGGRITTLDIDPKHAEIARKHFAASPHAHQIELILGPALHSLSALEGPFDLVFIDADKGNYRNYYEASLAKLSDGGVIAVDNVLWSGRIIDDSAADADTIAMREFNDYVVSDSRVECVMLTVRDGVTLIRKR